MPARVRAPHTDDSACEMARGVGSEYDGDVSNTFSQTLGQIVPQQPNSRDVRMRGFRERASVEAALTWIDERCRPLPAEAVGLGDATGRVLSSAVTAPIDVPSFDRSAMDGYAVSGGSTDGAGDYNPLAYQIVGQSMPGRPFAGTVQPQQAVRIMTGAPLPNGCDAVVPAEFAEETDGTVQLTQSVPPGKHVGRVGEDIGGGSELLPVGRRLRPQDLGVIASVGLPRVDVVRRPRVRLLITGNELATPGEAKGEHQIYESNSAIVNGLVLRDGGEWESVRRLPDDRAAIQGALQQTGADVILISGGSSVGAEDHAPSIIAEIGTLDIHGVAMRPSSPAGMGTIANSLVFLLPGNPVSCLCAYDFFAGRAIRVLGGRPAAWPHRRETLTVARKIVSAVGRVDYCRVQTEGDKVTPLALSGASILSSTTRADGFVIVPAELEGYAPGSQVSVYRYE